MSGFVGMVNVDGAPIDRRLLQQLTDSLTYRGPDAQELWIDRSVGLGHAMLRTTAESNHEHQPRSFDGEVWIVGDVRIDGRADLIRKLALDRQERLRTTSDVELVLHAYHAWGDDCVQHLLGDFAYAIWDRRRQRLFCSRDQLGVKPFFYAETACSLVFGNTLNCLRLHPAISSDLNDLALADFLLFGYNQEPTTTAFVDIRRLAPGHHFIWSDGSLRHRRYWTLPVGAQIQYRRASNYVDRFKEVWRIAVEDRLRTDRVGVFMSGGLDSSSVAVTAHQLLSTRRSPFDLRAYTVVYDRLIPDDERHFAGLTAGSLKIPIHYLTGDGYELFDRCDGPLYHAPEPSDNPLPVLTLDQIRQVSHRCRVALTGEGGDAALSPSASSYFADLLRNRRPWTLIADVVRCVAHGLAPPFGLRSTLQRWRGREWRPVYPPWVSQDLEARLDLTSRWKELVHEPASLHPYRPGAYHQLRDPFWPCLFETYDPGVTQCPVVFHHPFFDVRLLSYLLAVPPMPWFLKKELLREAMVGATPEAIRRRAKTPLAESPICALLRQPGAERLNHVDAVPGLLEYVDVKRISQAGGLLRLLDRDDSNWHLVTRPLCLNYWLAHVGSYPLSGQGRNSYADVGRRQKVERATIRQTALR